jgi:hypothetical protein
MTETPIHEQCTQHPVTCKNIKEVKEDHRLLASALGDRVKTKTMIGLQAIFTTIFLALFGFSVSISNEGNETVSKIRADQQELKLQVRELQVMVEDVDEKVVEVKQTLRENGFRKK